MNITNSTAQNQTDIGFINHTQVDQYYLRNNITMGNHTGIPGSVHGLSYPSAWMYIVSIAFNVLFFVLQWKLYSRPSRLFTLVLKIVKEYPNSFRKPETLCYKENSEWRLGFDIMHRWNPKQDKIIEALIKGGKCEEKRVSQYKFIGGEMILMTAGKVVNNKKDIRFSANGSGQPPLNSDENAEIFWGLKLKLMIEDVQEEAKRDDGQASRNLQPLIEERKRPAKLLFDCVVAEKKGNYRLYTVEIGTDNVLNEIGRLTEDSIPVFDEILAQLKKHRDDEKSSLDKDDFPKLRVKLERPEYLAISFLDQVQSLIAGVFS